jgi:CHASE2 domain-containing sensor protein
VERDKKPQRKPWPKEWLETLQLTALTAVMFASLSWAADCRCLSRVSESLSDVQDKTLDFLTKLEASRYGSEPASNAVPVRLVAIDDPTVETYSPGSYVFNRGALTRLLEGIEASSPKAIFLDFDLTRASNEPVKGKASLSSGDRQFLEFLRQPRSHPIFLNRVGGIEGTMLLGSKARDLKLGNVCFVSPLAVRDQDNIVRRIPRRVAASELLPASEAMYREAMYRTVTSDGGKSDGGPAENACSSATSTVTKKSPYAFQDAYGGIGNRMVFREPELWRGYATVSARSVLETTPLGLFDGAIVMVGRTDRESGDDHLTPMGRIPGVLLHVNELMTLMTFGRKVAPLSPFLGAGLAFAFTTFALFFTPWLMRILSNQLEKRLKPDDNGKPVEVKLENFLERPVIWLSLFTVAAICLHQFGVFVDFAFPILALELARFLHERKLRDIATKALNWGLRR